MPNNKLKQFHDSIKGNKNIVGIPDDYNKFESTLKDPSKSKAFYDAISTNSSITGIPKSYEEFGSSLGLIEKKNPKTPTESSGTENSTVGNVDKPISKKNLQSYIESAQKMGQNISGLKSNVPDFKPEISSIKKNTVDLKKAAEDLAIKKQQEEAQAIKEKEIEDMGAVKATWERTKSSMSTLGRSFINGLVAAPSEQVAILSKTIDDELIPLLGGQPLKKPITEYATYKFAKSIEGATDKNIKSNPLFEGELQEDVAGTVGDLLGVIATAVISKNPSSALAKMGTKGVVKGLANAATRKEVTGMLLKEGIKSLSKPATFVAAAQTGVRQYDEAISKGATEEQASAMYYSTAISGGLLETLPVGKLLTRFDKASGGMFKSTITSGLKGGAEEWITEGLQGVTANWAAKNIYDDTRQLFDGVASDANMGFGMGFVFNAFGVSLGKARYKFKNNPKKIAEIDASEQFLKDLSEQTASGSVPTSKENKAKIEKYQQVIDDPNTPQSAKDIASNSIAKIRANDITNKESEVSKMENMSEDEMAEYQMWDNDINELENSKIDIVDVDLRDEIDSTVKELKAKRDELLNKERPGLVKVEEGTSGELSSGNKNIENIDFSGVTEVNTDTPLTDREKQMLIKPEDRSSNTSEIVKLFPKLDKAIEKVKIPDIVTKFTKMFTVGDLNTVRAKEIVDAEQANTVDKVKSIASKLKKSIGDSEVNKKLANDIISMGNIDDTISKLAYSDSFQATSDLLEGKYSPNEIRAATEHFNGNNQNSISSIDKNKFEQIIGDLSKLSQKKIIDKRTSDASEIKSLVGKIINFNTIGKSKTVESTEPTLIIGGQSVKFPGKSIGLAKDIAPDIKDSSLSTNKGESVTLEDLRAQLLSKPKGEEILNEIDKAVAVKNEAISELSKTQNGREILKSSNEARAIIDKLSQDLLNSKSASKIQERIGETVAGNMGTYLKRTFKAFKNKDFNPSEASKQLALQSIIDDMMVKELTQLYKSKEYQKTIKKKEGNITSGSEVGVFSQPEGTASELVPKENDIIPTNSTGPTQNNVTVEDYREWSSGREIKDIDQFRADYLKQLYEDVERKAKIELNTYLDDIRRRKEEGPASQLSRSLQKIDGNSLEMRKVFDASFVDMLGNTNNPISQFIDTVMAQSQIKAAADLHWLINENSESNMIFDSKENLIEMNGSTKGFKEITDKNSLLGGKWVSEDIYDVISSEIINFDGMLFGVYKKVLGTMRKSKTIYNPAGWPTNWMGGIATQFANGILTNPSKIVKYSKNRALYIKNPELLDVDILEDIQTMKDTGWWSTSISGNTIKLLDDELLDMDVYDSEKISSFKKVLNKGKVLDDNVIRNYSVIDDFTKLVFFREKKDIFAKKAFGKKYSELSKDEKAIATANLVERGKQNVATTSRLPRFYKKIVSLPFGDFMAFRISALISGKNTMLNAIDDYKKSRDKSLSKEQRDAYFIDFLKTSSGFSFSAALNSSIYGSLASLAMGLFGEKDDVFEEKKVNGKNIGSKSDLYIDFKGTPAVNPQWMRGKNNIPISDDGKGNLELVNISNKDPYDELYGLSFIPRAGTSFEETVSGIFQEVASPNMAVKLITSVLEGKDQWGRDIYSGDNSELEKKIKVVSYIMSESLIPPSIKNIHKQSIIDNQESKAKPGMSKKDIKDIDVSATEYIGSVLKNSPKLINRTYNVNISEQLGYYGSDFYKANRDKFDRLTPDEKVNRIKDLQRIRDGYLYIEKYSQMHNNPEFLSEARSNLFEKSRGISREEKNYIVTGIEPTYNRPN